MEKKFNFVYLTTNVINGKQYIGDHSTDNLNDHYIGSGKIIKEAIKKYNKKNFNCVILEFCSSKKEAEELQEKYIIQYETLEPKGYNINPKGGFINNYQHSTITRQKISKSKKGKPTWNKNLKNCYSPETIHQWSNTRKGRKCLNKASFCAKGRKFSDEHKKNLSISKIGNKNSKGWLSNKILKKCKYCGIETTSGNYGRWHGEKCKHKFSNNL